MSWLQGISAWGDSAKLRVDALGLVTLLGAEDINTSVGRLTPSHYFDALPLLGAHVIAGNRFAEKQPGYSLYNISAGLTTTELAPWFSRWLRAQDFGGVRGIVSWADAHAGRGVTKSSRFWVGFVLVGVPVNGMLVALAVLLADGWGLANAMAMIVSILVRFVLVWQNRAGIDANVAKAKADADAYMAGPYPSQLADYQARLAEYEKEHEQRGRGMDHTDRARPVAPRRPSQRAKVIVIRADSKVVTIDAPDYLVRIFAISPALPNPVLYNVFRLVGWLAFAVHIISVGMATLPVQIYTVLLLGIATILHVTKVGCDDSTLWRRLRARLGLKGQPSTHPSAMLSSRLQASLSEYPEGEAPETRRDLFVCLDLDEEEEECVRAWNLFPRTRQWWDVYQEKKKQRRDTRAHPETKKTATVDVRDVA